MGVRAVLYFLEFLFPFFTPVRELNCQTTYYTNMSELLSKGSDDGPVIEGSSF
jgi:hypothetical protein